MSKPEEQEELTVDFFDEVEDVVDEEQALETEQQDPEEVVEPTEESEEIVVEESEEESEEDLPLVESIRQRLGYDFEEEFEDTEEGIQLLVERARDKAAEDAVNAYFDVYPEVKELLEYRQMGGDPDKFFQTKFPEVDYSKVELAEDDESQLENIVKHELKLVRNMNDDEIRAEIEDYKNGGILESKAKRSLASLKAKQQLDKNSLIEEQKQIDLQNQQQIEQQWQTIEKTIKDSGSLKGFTIPSKDKDAFYMYLHKPVQDGKSQAMIDHETADLETRLAVDYLMFNGFKLSDIISRKAKDVNTKTLRDRMRSVKLDKKRDESVPNTIEELGTI